MPSKRMEDMSLEELQELRDEMEMQKQLETLQKELRKLKTERQRGEEPDSQASVAPPPSTSMSGKSYMYFYLVMTMIVGGLLLWARMGKQSRSSQSLLDFTFPPPVLVLEGWAGRNAHRMNGVYRLRKEAFNDRPVWEKRLPVGGDSESYLLRDDCGAWLLSHDPTGDGEKCDGWAFATGCGSPWRCGGQWRVFGGKPGGWTAVGEEFSVTPLWQEDLHPGPCSDEEDAALGQRFGDTDLVIVWANSSDPEWRRRRRDACVDHLWRWTWPDAVRRRSAVTRCDAGRSQAAGGDDAGATCASTEGGAGGGAAGCEARPPCFVALAEEHCGEEASPVDDPELLRYALRTWERHAPWHTGRILLVVPTGQRPRWLREGRVEVVEREALLRSATSSARYVPQAKRRGAGGYAPERALGDAAALAALHLLPGLSEEVLVLRGGLVVARPLRPCGLWTAGGGARLFAEPAAKHLVEDSHANLAQTGAVAALRLLREHRRSVGWARAAGVYYRPDAATPALLNVSVLRELWAAGPDLAAALSATVDSAAPHPGAVDIVGLHHSVVAERARLARAGCATEATAAIRKWLARQKARKSTGGRRRGAEEGNGSGEVSRPRRESGRSDDAEDGAGIAAPNFTARDAADSLARTWIVDPGEFQESVLPLPLRSVVQVRIENGTEAEWEAAVHERMDPADAATLPQMLSFRDASGAARRGVACLRQRWLSRLAPTASTFEDASDEWGPCRGTDEPEAPE